MKLAVVCLLVACSKPSEPRSRGAFMFEGDRSDTFLATEAEVVRSEPIVRRVREDLRLDAIDPGAIAVERRPGTTILNVFVTNKDPLAATEICNRMIQAYIESRMERALGDLATSAQAISAELERRPDDADLKRKLAELELQRTTRRGDVLLLERCAMPR